MCNPKFTLYHSNLKGTGSKLSLSLYPSSGDTQDGYIEMSIAPQKTVGGNGILPSYDDDESITAHLGFDDLCQFLQVFRGEIETINDGRGLYHCNESGYCRIALRHLIDPVCVYLIEMYHADHKSGETTLLKFSLTNAEACGLTEALAGSMGMIVFGKPAVIPYA